MFIARAQSTDIFKNRGNYIFAGKKMATIYEKKIKQDLKDQESVYKQVEFLKNELELQGGNADNRQVIKGYLRKLVPKNEIAKFAGIALTRAEYLGAAKKFGELGMRPESREYAKKALQGITPEVFSQMSLSDKAEAYELLGKGGKAESLYRTAAEKSLKGVRKLEKEGRYGQAIGELDSRIEELEKIGAKHVANNLDHRKKILSTKRDVAFDKINELISKVRDTGKETLSSERIGWALQAGKIAYLASENMGDNLSYLLKGKMEESYALALALSDDTKYEKDVKKELKKLGWRGKEILENPKRIKEIRRTLELA